MVKGFKEFLKKEADNEKHLEAELKRRFGHVLVKVKRGTHDFEIIGADFKHFDDVEIDEGHSIYITNPDDLKCVLKAIYYSRSAADQRDIYRVKDVYWGDANDYQGDSADDKWYQVRRW